MTDHGYVEKEGGFHAINSEILDRIKPILDQGKIVRFSGPGHRMLPFIRPEDVLSIEPILKKPTTGDVVAYIDPIKGSLVIHRVVQRHGSSYTMKGDNLDEAFRKVHRANMLGKVVEVERAGKIIRFGLGPERRLIAYLSRLGLLRPVVKLASRFLGIFRSGKNLS